MDKNELKRMSNGLSEQEIKNGILDPRYVIKAKCPKVCGLNIAERIWKEIKEETK